MNALHVKLELQLQERSDEVVERDTDEREIYSMLSIIHKTHPHQQELPGAANHKRETGHGGSPHLCNFRCAIPGINVICCRRMMEKS